MSKWFRNMIYRTSDQNRNECGWGVGDGLGRGASEMSSVGNLMLHE